MVTRQKEIAFMPDNKLPKYTVISILLIICAIFVMAFIFVPQLSVGLIQNECPNCDSASAIKIASQIGRLDVVSLALGFVGIGVGFFAIFSFFAVKDEACDSAKRTARTVIKEQEQKLQEMIIELVQLESNRAINRVKTEYNITKIPSDSSKSEVENEK